MNAVEFPSHPHPLNPIELLPREEKEEEGSRLCGLCGETIKGPGYECSECNFAAHIGCAENPPSLVIEESKIHEHPLTLLPRHVSFTCNACGLSGDKSPYVCLKCSFMTHKDCVDFPRILKINRHDHRLSYTWFLGPGHWKCGVCRRKIDWNYGAYKCAKCCSYAAHLRCALRVSVWDGKELMDEEEDDDFEGTALLFSREDNRVILHFSHEHSLRLEDQDRYQKKDKDVFCSGCTLPIAFETFYRCGDHDLCDFFLHERCANLPRKKNTCLHVHPLTLCAEQGSGPNGLSRCGACDLHFNGFKYRCLECKNEHIEFDMRCPSVSEPFFKLHLHPYPLFSFNVGINEKEETKICNVCNHETKYVLSCDDHCEFNMCWACATLPDEVAYKYDEHLLSHTIGEDVTTNPCWCDVCENKMDFKSKRNFYECLKCGPVLHTDCAVGSFRNMRPGFTFVTPHGQEYQMILNDRTSLLRCNQCHNDCHEPLLLMSTTTTTVATIYLCSSRCFTAYVSV